MGVRSKILKKYFIRRTLRAVHTKSRAQLLNYSVLQELGGLCDKHLSSDILVVECERRIAPEAILTFALELYKYHWALNFATVWDIWVVKS